MSAWALMWGRRGGGERWRRRWFSTPPATLVGILIYFCRSIYICLYMTCFVWKIQKVPRYSGVVWITTFWQRWFLNLSAPEILQRPAPQQGAPLFGAPRPERPRAPANPDAWCTRAGEDPSIAPGEEVVGLAGRFLPQQAASLVPGSLQPACFLLEPSRFH